MPGSRPAPAEDEGWIRPTTGFWQAVVPRERLQYADAPPYRYGYPVRLPDGLYLELPLRRVAGEAGHAVASLIPNQAAMAVCRVLARHMAGLARPIDAEAVIGLPTLGMALAPLVAEHLGLARYVPLGYSRKFWYTDALAEEVSSLTTPGQGKKVYLDPNQLPLVAGRRVMVVDDTVSNGSTALAVLRLLERAGAEVAGCVVAMRQGSRWRARLGGFASRVHGVFDTPRFERRADGWYPVED